MTMRCTIFIHVGLSKLLVLTKRAMRSLKKWNRATKNRLHVLFPPQLILFKVVRSQDRNVLWLIFISVQVHFTTN